jgi:hypothetical protein
LQDDSTLVVGAEREKGAPVRVFSKRDAPFIEGGLVLAEEK